MANFFLIDHSLRSCGGHHYDYVRSVAQAANQLGLFTTIGTNRAFREEGSETGEPLGNVRKVFRDTTYQPDSYLAGLQHVTRSESLKHLLDSYRPGRRFNWETLKKFNHQRRRERFVQRFALDCERFFRPLLQVPGDHAFLTTVSELELMGLAAYLSKFPETEKTHWHLQFHFNLFAGRTPEYEGQQEVLKTVRSCCQAALAQLASHSIHFYTTSDVLVDQYRRLEIGPFQSLPYPISPEFSPRLANPILNFNEGDLAGILKNSENHEEEPIASFQSPNPTSEFASASPENGLCVDTRLSGKSGERDSSAKRTPLRITCPGGVRREKGHVEYLQPLVEKIWDSQLVNGNVQIVVQRPPKKWHSSKQKIDLQIPDNAFEGTTQASPIEYFSHPLKHDDYVNLIKSTDCGLLFYDNRVYYSRRAGVLGELLSCGKPVIVPAGSWLAEQIAEPIFRHADQLIRNSGHQRVLGASDFRWDCRNVPMPGGVLSFDRRNHPFDFSINRCVGENVAAFEFDWHWPELPGTYCQIKLIQKDRSGTCLETTPRVIGARRSGRKSNVIFRLHEATDVLEFSLTNAFHDSTASICRANIRMLDTPAEYRESGAPIGGVGIIAANQEDLPNCIDELVTHYEHYQKTALDFSPRWYAQHDPQMTVSHLVTTSQSDSVDHQEAA